MGIRSIHGSCPTGLPRSLSTFCTYSIYLTQQMIPALLVNPKWHYTDIFSETHNKCINTNKATAVTSFLSSLAYNIISSPPQWRHATLRCLLNMTGITKLQNNFSLTQLETQFSDQIRSTGLQS